MMMMLWCVCSCVIAELFTEGTSAFDLSQLLAYRSGEYSPSKLFHSIDDVNIRVSSSSDSGSGGNPTSPVLFLLHTVQCTYTTRYELP